MILTINNNVLIQDIKDHFRKCYPGLKIEFYKRTHKNKKGSPNADLVDDNAFVGSIRKEGMSGDYKIYSYYTVEKVEGDLHNIYGLNAQVFRNENNCWIQTTGTDHFTLAQQMEMCKHADKSVFPLNKEQVDEYDYL